MLLIFITTFVCIIYYTQHLCHSLTVVPMMALQGGNLRIIPYNPHQKVNTSGLNDHEVRDIMLDTIRAYAELHHDLVIVVMNHYALPQNNV